MLYSSVKYDTSHAAHPGQAHCLDRLFPVHIMKSEITSLFRLLFLEDLTFESYEVLE